MRGVVVQNPGASIHKVRTRQFDDGRANLSWNLAAYFVVAESVSKFAVDIRSFCVYRLPHSVTRSAGGG